MGIVASVLSAIGCGPRSGAAAGKDYAAVLHTGKALAVDTAAGGPGFRIVDGDRVVLELHAELGASRVAYDKGTTWTVVVELPRPADGAAPVSLALEGVTTVARAAGEDVVYLARGAHGRLELARTTPATAGASITGSIDATFEHPERDLLGLGAYHVAGPLKVTSP